MLAGQMSACEHFVTLLFCLDSQWKSIIRVLLQAGMSKCYLLFLFCVGVCVFTCAKACLWRSGDNS